jgi:hypothetical protein
MGKCQCSTTRKFCEKTMAFFGIIPVTSHLSNAPATFSDSTRGAAPPKADYL